MEVPASLPFGASTSAMLSAPAWAAATGAPNQQQDNLTNTHDPEALMHSGLKTVAVHSATGAVQTLDLSACNAVLTQCGTTNGPAQTTADCHVLLSSWSVKDEATNLSSATISELQLLEEAGSCAEDASSTNSLFTLKIRLAAALADRFAGSEQDNHVTELTLHCNGQTPLRSALDVMAIHFKNVKSHQLRMTLLKQVVTDTGELEWEEEISPIQTSSAKPVVTAVKHGQTVKLSHAGGASADCVRAHLYLRPFRVRLRIPHKCAGMMQVCSCHSCWCGGGDNWTVQTIALYSDERLPMRRLFELIAEHTVLGVDISDLRLSYHSRVFSFSDTDADQFLFPSDCIPNNGVIQLVADSGLNDAVMGIGRKLVRTSSGKPAVVNTMRAAANHTSNPKTDDDDDEYNNIRGVDRAVPHNHDEVNFEEQLEAADPARLAVEEAQRDTEAKRRWQQRTQRQALTDSVVEHLELDHTGACTRLSLRPRQVALGNKRPMQQLLLGAPDEGHENSTLTRPRVVHAKGLVKKGN